jgi:hypothetical protein
MSVVKLNSNHSEQIKDLFMNKKYMGLDISDPAFKLEDTTFNRLTYDIFCNNYLSDLKNFHAYGYIQDNTVKSLISFYESVEEPAWYYTIYRSSGDNELLRPVLDSVIEHNESQGRLKFYTLVHKRHSRLLRRFHWSKYNNERYGYFDEFIVPERCKCYYTNAWELLYKRMLLPEESIVRCNYLKQEYRTELPIGGNI